MGFHAPVHSADHLLGHHAVSAWVACTLAVVEVVFVLLFQCAGLFPMPCGLEGASSEAEEQGNEDFFHEADSIVIGT